MRKLPQADELPHTEEGYDPARVEEAFAAFADRVRELESVASELRAELQGDPRRANRSRTLRGRGLAGRERAFEHRPRRSPDWVAAVPPPFARHPGVAAARLRGTLPVARRGPGRVRRSVCRVDRARDGSRVGTRRLTEWAAAAKRSRWRLEEIAPPADAASKPAADTTGPWDMPVVEATVVESGPDPESKTIIAKLPVQAEAGARVPSPRPSRRRSAGGFSAAASPPRRALPILSAIPGRRSLAAAVAAAFLITVVPAPPPARRCPRHCVRHRR